MAAIRTMGVAGVAETACSWCSSVVSLPAPCSWSSRIQSKPTRPASSAVREEPRLSQPPREPFAREHA
ncbi:MAG: hypothetical protein ACREIA_24895 [Opitutaceae bacterium]